jgi:hypothetical protein
MTDEVTNGQSVQALYQNLGSHAHDGRGVIDGCDVTIDSGELDQPDTLALSAGDVWTGWTPTPVPGQSVRIDAADSAPRKDLVVIDQTGTASAVSGTPRQPPSDQPTASRFDLSQPAPPSRADQGGVVIAEVFVPASAATLSADDIQRRIPPTPPQRIIDTLDLTLTGGQDPAADVSALDVSGTQTQALTAVVSPRTDPTHSAAYGWTTDTAKVWDGSWTIDLTLTWTTDPGAGNDVDARAYIIEHL